MASWTYAISSSEIEGRVMAIFSVAICMALEIRYNNAQALKYFEARDKNYKPAPPFPDILQLFPDFIPYIPGEDDDVVGAFIPDTLLACHRDMACRQVFVLFSGVGI